MTDLVIVASRQTYERAFMKNWIEEDLTVCAKIEVLDPLFLFQIALDDRNSSSLNLKETELRLGLPGCESPERKSGSTLCLFAN
ncbi:hypothetical protein GYH30_048225 [Glycine max]|nr:hypothetical protein GYH30_048225 [Glycine max]